MRDVAAPLAPSPGSRFALATLSLEGRGERALETIADRYDLKPAATMQIEPRTGAK